MGVDVNIYLIPSEPISDDRIAEANQYLSDRGINPDPPFEMIARPDDDCGYDDGRIVFLSCHRYYGVGYERGHWPHIYAVLRCIQAVFPDCALFYGGDSTDDGQPVTDALLESLWQHFLGPDGDAYFRR